MTKTGSKKDTRASDSKGKKGSQSKDNDIDPFAALFAGFDPDQHYVNVTRLEPKEFQGTHIRGYLERILPGVDEEYLKDRFGGGKFMLQKKNNDDHVIVATRFLEIAGLPKVPLPVASAPTDEEAGHDPVVVNIGGVKMPYTENIAIMERMMLFVKALNAAFREPPDINETLMKLLVERPQQPDMLDSIHKLKDVSELFHQKGGGGDGMYGVIQTAIAEAGGVIQKMLTPGLAKIPVAGRRAGPGGGPSPGLTLAARPVNGSGRVAPITDIRPGEQPTAETENPEQETDTMSQQQAILAIASTIVKCWRLDPPLEVNKVVNLIDMILNLADAAPRAALVTQYSGTVTDICETELVEDWTDPETTVGKRDAFGEFCKAIFEEYGRPDREVKLL